MSAPVSPLFPAAPVTHIKDYDNYQVAALYQQRLGIDIKRHLTAGEKTSLYCCQQSGLEFFWPRNTDGDGKFYEDLQRFPWYYIPDKWEHKAVLNYVNEGTRILEIGCAQGSFLKQCQAKGATVTGLELNEEAAANCQNQGMNVHAQLIQDYAAAHEGQYDIVCSFHVVEHIADLESFMTASIKCLKKGGLLFVAVPNNDSFMGADPWNILNMPPHHMNRWNEQSMEQMANAYQHLKFYTYLQEPFVASNATYFTRILKNQLAAKYGVLVRVFFKLFQKPIEHTVKSLGSWFKGFTIVGVYTKQ